MGPSARRAVRHRLAPLLAAASLAAMPLAAPLATPLAAQAPTTPTTPTAPACPAGPVALVLPGGGVRGMAHVGVIQVLDSLGVVPDLVVGTSMGAIVGALYASGYDGREIERLTREYDLGAYVGRYAPRAPRALGPQRPLLLWEEGEGGAFDLETAAAQEGRINGLLAALMLRGNLLARGDFDRLPVPFRAVATDLRTGGRVTLARGDLAEAVRASFAIPLVFDPVQLDGHTLVDGGLAENVPVRLARELGAGRVLLSGLPIADVAGVPRTPAMAQRLVDLLFDQTYPSLGEADVAIASAVDDTPNLDFRDTTVRTMVARGRAAAQRAFGALAPEAMRCLTSASAERRAHRAALAVPALAEPLLAHTATGEARHFVEKTLGARVGGTLAFDTLQARLARLGEVEAIRAAWLHPVAVGGTGAGDASASAPDSVALAPVLQLAPRRAVGAGLAYDGDLGGRAWVGMVDRRVAGRPLEIALRGGVGEWRQDAHVELRKGVEDVRDARAPFVLARVSREDVRLFTRRGVELARTELPRVRERVVMAGVDLPRGDRLELQAALFIRQWDDARESATLPTSDVTRETTASGLALQLRAGDGTRRLVRLEGEWTPRYGRALVVARRGLGTGHWQASGSVRLGAVGREAPLTAWLPLGGSEGFAGLRIGERLGRAEASAAVEVSRAMMGPVRMQLTLMGGQVSVDPARPLDGAWLGGARVGVGADTPIGPVRAQYGVNGDRRSQWYLRVGHWF